MVEKNKDINTITISKECFSLLQKAIGERTCKYCKKEITRNNFGYLSVDINSCNNIFCLYELCHELED